MSGISSRAASNSPINRKKFTGKEEQRQEFSDGSGLEWTDFGARMYDNQRGRWFNIDNKADSFYMFSPYNYTLNNPIKFVDPDGNGVDIVINKQQVQGQNQIKATVTINLTIVNPGGKYQFGEAHKLQLSQMVHNDYSGSVYTTSKDSKGKDVSTTIDVDVQLNITVVTDASKAKSTDYIIGLVDDIPFQQNTTEGPSNPVGLAEGTGDVGAVEANYGGGGYTNSVISHELGHILGLGHSPNTRMEKSIDTNPNNRSSGTNSAQRRQLWEWLRTLPNGNNTNRMGTSADSRTELNNFISRTSITW